MEGNQSHDLICNRSKFLTDIETQKGDLNQPCFSCWVPSLLFYWFFVGSPFSKKNKNKMLMGSSRRTDWVTDGLVCLTVPRFYKIKMDLDGTIINSKLPLTLCWRLESSSTDVFLKMCCMSDPTKIAADVWSLSLHPRTKYENDSNENVTSDLYSQKREGGGRYWR